MSDVKADHGKFLQPEGLFSRINQVKRPIISYTKIMDIEEKTKM